MKKINFESPESGKAKVPGDSGSVVQKHGPVTLPDTVRGKKKSSTPITSDRTVDKGGPDKNTKTSNKNLPQGEQLETDTVRTV